MSAGHERTVRLVLRNAGSRAWSARDSFVTPKWYRWDGRWLAAGEDHHLPSDTQPGNAVELEVPVNGPPAAGPYWLTWQATINGRPASSLRHAPPVSAVKIRSDTTHTLDLSAFVNVGAITTDSGRARGGFDASGRSLPAEWLPPDQAGPAVDVYPGGYYAPWSSADLPFAFPATTSGVGGAVACIGQSIPLGKQGAVRVHLLAASAADPREATFALRGPAGPTDWLTVRVPSWARRDDTVAVGAYVPYVRSLAGDEAAPAYLYHVILEPASPGAVSLELPRAPDIKVLAMTVETE